MADRPPPKGRGAALLEALKKKKELEKTVGVVEEKPKETEAPRPKGRAEFLKKLQESRLKRVGASSDTTVSTKTTEDITQEFSELSVGGSTVDEPVYYKGSTGKPLRVSANYIKLYVKERGVYEYEVNFEPELDARNRRSKAVHLVIKELGYPKVFDGGSILYLPKKITDTSKTFSTNLPGPDGDQEISVTIKFKKVKSIGDRECLHLYNVLFKRIMHILLYTPMGRNYFNPNHRTLIPQHKLEVYPGYAISIDEQEDGLMVCLDTQHRVLRTQNAYELLIELKSNDPQRFVEAARSNIIGSCIFTRYNNKTYTVDDIAWNMNPRDNFKTRDGGEISFIDYFKNQYGLVIKDVNQPLLINRRNVKVSGSSVKEERMICLIPELSYLTGLTNAMRSDFKVMKDVAQHTRITPNQRIAALRTYLDNVRKSDEAQRVLSEWGLSLDNNPINLQGRQLENEMIYFGQGGQFQNETGDWTRASGDNKVTGPVDMLHWILFFTERDQRNAKEFAQHMVRLGGVMGCRINQPKPVKLQDDRNETYMRACREHIDRNVQVVVFICPTMRSDRYSIIKKMCCVEHPVASQVINSRTLCNPSKVRAIIQKIALQITCKLGGTLWTIRFPFKGWMICGIDVYHGGSGGSGSGGSVCGFVASLNESISRWHSVALFQEKELGDFLKIAFTKSLETYRNESGCFPSKVVIIRDGVGDGQLEHCKRYEVAQLESVIKEFGLDTKLCFIVVQKRINTRIYSINGNGANNPPAGTVIDYAITRKYLADFFLVPQSVRQGTVNPTHYIVLHDKCDLKPDHVQRLCYKLCHLYYNWPGTIRVPAPCQYAHKLAALVGQHIKKAPSVELSDKLFYL